MKIVIFRSYCYYLKEKKRINYKQKNQQLFMKNLLKIRERTANIFHWVQCQLVPG